LFENIGSYDAELDCLYPVYLAYPEIPKHEIVQDEAYIMPLLLKYFDRVEDLQKGDLLLFEFFDGFHFGVYAGVNQFFHCCKNHKLRISRLSVYSKYQKGGFRCKL